MLLSTSQLLNTSEVDMFPKDGGLTILILVVIPNYVRPGWYTSCNYRCEFKLNYLIVIKKSIQESGYVYNPQN